jgi:hypothetical protein
MAKFFTAAPSPQRRSIERYSALKKAQESPREHRCLQRHGLSCFRAHLADFGIAFNFGC